MTSLGGHGIAYMTGDSPIGEKESYEDTGAVLSRMCDAVTARVKSREQVNGLAENATIQHDLAVILVSTQLATSCPPRARRACATTVSRRT